MQYITYLKGQCYEIFYIFLNQETLPVPHMNRLKRFRKFFRFREESYSRSQLLHEHQQTLKAYYRF